MRVNEELTETGRGDHSHFARLAIPTIYIYIYTPNIPFLYSTAILALYLPLRACILIGGLIRLTTQLGRSIVLFPSTGGAQIGAPGLARIGDLRQYIP